VSKFLIQYQLDDLEESPMSYSTTPSASVLATNIPDTSLSIASALSPTSVYSQDSWNPNSSSMQHTENVDTRRHSMMRCSPSVQCEVPVSGHLDGMFCKRTVRTAPPPSPRTPSSARLKMSISTSTSGKPYEGNVVDGILIGSVQLVDEPNPVVAIRIQ
jgi:hypothetical protein